eukprot:1013941-Rhodomonas_salina.1
MSSPTLKVSGSPRLRPRLKRRGILERRIPKSNTNSNTSLFGGKGIFPSISFTIAMTALFKSASSPKSVPGLRGCE